jgi:hypothetical protein
MAVMYATYALDQESSKGNKRVVTPIPGNFSAWWPLVNRLPSASGGRKSSDGAARYSNDDLGAGPNALFF